MRSDEGGGREEEEPVLPLSLASPRSFPFMDGGDWWWWAAIFPPFWDPKKGGKEAVQGIVFSLDHSDKEEDEKNGDAFQGEEEGEVEGGPFPFAVLR